MRERLVAFALALMQDEYTNVVPHYLLLYRALSSDGSPSRGVVLG
jgi:hypothetical protein